MGGTYCTSRLFSYLILSQEYLDRRRTAHRHRLGRLFEAWHLAVLASSASSKAVVRGFRRRRAAAALAADFRAWASLSRARRWRRRRLLGRGLGALASFAAGSGHAATAAASAFPKRRRQGVRGWWWDGATAAAVASAAGGLAGPGELVLSSVKGAREGFLRNCLKGRTGGEVSAAGGARVFDPEAVASAHRRRVRLSRGYRALLRTGSAEELRRTRQPFFFARGRRDRGGKGAVVVGVRAARAAFRTWLETARGRKRARDGVAAGARAWRRDALARGVRELGRFALAAARRRRAERASLLRESFAAFRQVGARARARARAQRVPKRVALKLSN